MKHLKNRAKEFEQDLVEPLTDFEDIKKEAGLPKYLEEVMDIIKPRIDDLSETMRRTALVVRMAVTYPAILDVTPNALIS